MKTADKLFLLDAYALIYRAYYALIKNPRINSKGQNTSAIMGFVNTLEEVLKKENPTHIGIAFDPAGPTFRHEAYPAYKAQREETPEDIRKSVPIIKEIIKAYNIPILEVMGFEADDVIGTLATKAGEKGIDTYMLTPDKDYGQLVKEHIYMYRPKFTGGFEIMGPEEVKAKYDLSSTLQVIDLLGLMGDASDNIPGCPGVGEKTAQKLIREFGSIENLLEHTDQLKGALKTKVETNKEQIAFSKFLATIKTDVPIELDIEALKVEEPNLSELKHLFDDLEFRSLYDRVLARLGSPKEVGTQDMFAGTLFATNSPTPSIQNEGATKKEPIQGDLFAINPTNSPDFPENSNLRALNQLEVDYQLIDTEEKRNEIIKKLLSAKILALDTETTGTEPMLADLVGMSFSDEENHAYYIPVPQDFNEAQKIVQAFKPVFENEASLKVGQNIKYDMIMLHHYGIEVKGPLFDTMLAHYVLQPELRHNMDYLAEIYLHYKTIHIDELIGAKGKNQKNMRDLSPTDIYMYACEDADITLQLKNILEQELKKEGVEQLFYEIEMPLVPVLVNMETNGVLLDTSALKQTSVLYNQRMNEIEQEIYQLAGMRFNISSPKQVGDILFKEMKLIEKPKKTKTGQYVTSEEVLESLRHKHSIVGKILDYRGLKKLLSTYIDALPELINPRTGRIHTSFNQAVTATGRLSSSNPNLQNIPVRDDDGKEIRKCFIPDPGCEFFSADYSQIELRIMAHLSGDYNMIDAFNHDYDVHAATAAKIYKVPMNDVSKDMRRKAKTANFGIIYGISSFGLSENLNIPVSKAKEFIENYHKTYPGIKEYMDGVVESAKETEVVKTIFGRKRTVSEINNKNYLIRSAAERICLNTPIQGSAADIMKKAMIDVYNEFERKKLKSKILVQVHDELVIDCKRDELDIVKSILEDKMVNVYKMRVKLDIDINYGNDWYDAK